MANKRIQECGFHHIALSASNFEKSLQFYTEGLGFTKYRSWKTETGRSIALLNFGNDTYVELFSDGKQEAVPVEPAGSYFHLALRTTDAEGAFHCALSAGAQPHKEPALCILPATPEMRVKIAFVKGPDGELIEFFEPQE